jgi:asparagine synthase (glutamine-hydrolysing)
VCGIAGILDPGAATDGEELAHVVGRMADALRHRGPDDAGRWIDAQAGIALGHRRLSVLDLSKAAHQPMVSASGRYVLSYNGEVYNFARLRPELERTGARFAGHGDTEVLLAGIEAWGVRRTLERCNGMWAFALWDRRERTLTLARDRMGEKPLYYGRAGRHIVFASELGAIRRHPHLRERVDRAALASFLRYGYVPAPRTILEGISKLGAGRLLSIAAGDGDGEDEDELPEPEQWWSPADVARAGRAGHASTRTRAGIEEAAALPAREELHELLLDAVGLRLAADVPLGALLSGGVDSSLLVALMQRLTDRPVRTFSVGFEERAIDEAGHARAVAAHLGTEHAELRVSGADALAAVSELPRVCDEPFADAAIVPTLLIARLARRHVTVAFAGDGGDELFYGYPRYRWAEQLRGVLAKVPPGACRALAAAALHAPAGPLNRLGASLGRPAHELAGDRLLKLAELAGGAGSPNGRASDGVYERLVSCWPRSPALGATTVVDPAFGLAEETLPPDDGAGRMALADLLTYLPQDILTKVDRASMSASLEARVPLLDHRVVELAWRLPAPNLRNGGSHALAKAPLREILYEYVPRHLVDRPKQGFETPLADWLRGPLRPWAQDLLSPRRLADDGLLDVQAIMRHWREHETGARNWQRRLWPVLMFQSWLSTGHV